MKYAKPLIALLLIGLGLSGIAGCAFNTERKPWPYDGSVAVELVPTEQYLPVQERDDNGRLLRYSARPNPYTALEGQIDKQIVTTYIDARRDFREQSFDRADQLLAKLAEQEPGLSGPRVMRGDIAREKGDLAGAVEHYVDAIGVNAINFNAWLRLAKVQRMRGHFNHAQNTYSKALALWPDGPELHLNLGVLYDVYLNQPLRAQAHMEAYELLSGGDNRVAAWLEEIRQRTGVANTLQIVGPEGEVESVSDSDLPATPDPLSALSQTGPSIHGDPIAPEAEE